MNAISKRSLSSLLLALLISACASNGELSTQATTRDFKTVAAKKSLADATVVAASWPDKNWWESFNDGQLNQLMQDALADSPTLKIAAARTRKALAFANSSKADLYPQLNAHYELTRERFSENGLVPPPVGGTWDTLHQLQGTLNWEVDVWGKNRAAYQQALGQAKATEVDAYAARLTLTTTIAQVYIQLQRAFLQLDVAEATYKDREKIYSLTYDRHLAGIDSRLELKQAEAALPATREQVIQLQETIQLIRNQLAALLGQGPDRSLAIDRPAASMLNPVTLPSTMPAELLGRRPDLIAQRARVESAQQGIKSAKAKFYPNVNLTAFVGLQSLGANNFLSAASRMEGFGPAISLPIFDVGRLRANLADKNADYDIAVEQYNQILADAMRDVVDQLASFRSINAQHTEQKKAMTIAQEAYDLARLRYQEGIGNYLQVLSAEAPLLAQRSLDAELRSRQLLISINLIRALGGGFEQNTSIPVATAN